MSSKLRFVGNAFEHKPFLSKPYANLVENLTAATLETFYPNGTRARIVSNSKSVIVSPASCDYVTLGAKFDLLADKHSPNYNSFVRSLYSDVDSFRAHHVSWKEKKTDREIEAHLAIHLLARLVVGFGVPTYDIEYALESKANNSISAFLYVVNSCVATLDFSDSVSSIIGENLIRILIYLHRRGYGSDFDSLSNVTVSSVDRFELTPFETFELASFRSDLREFGLPNIKITRKKAFNPPSNILDL